MLPVLFLSALLTLLHAAPSGATVIPRGAHVLLDGRLGPGEWTDAARIALSRGDELLVKRDDRYLYIAVRAATPELYGVDLYGDQGGESILNFHASAKLGEREGKGSEWPDWSWWNNRDWSANVARGDDFEKRQFRRDEAKELQIALTRFRTKTLFVSVDVQSRSGTTTLPEKGTTRGERTWVPLELR